ncbi:FAD-dependent oxidoreductase [Corynebacterium belfantii]|uniref:FAD-dependent oxidoreductase n=1 Tax=Corynebacterium belfantii TaxID=2014537 RepID=UPI000A852AC2|nr:FAD-dependent oxidoreductase [Corynebacterium belfantii]
MITGEVTSVDADQKKLILSNGGVTDYDKLILATGGHARRGDTPGFDDDDIIVLRTTEDALALRESLTQGATVGIIGAVLIGVEVASSARSLGAHVVLIEPAPISLIPAGALNWRSACTDYTKIMAWKSMGIDSMFLLMVLAPSVWIPCCCASDWFLTSPLADSAELECDGGVLVDHDQRTDNPRYWGDW